MQQLILIVYSATFFFYMLALVLKLLGLKPAARCTGFMALSANAAILILITISSGHLPLFELFESLLLTVFMLGLLVFFFPEQHKDSDTHIPDTGMWAMVEILCILIITLFFPKTASPFVYDHDNIYILLFFGFRLGALSVTLFSSAQFIRFRWKLKKNQRDYDLLRKGRNFLLLGTVLFLVSEYAGIIWCQNGWGDFWHWNSGFFQSTLIVLYLMLFCHIPGKNYRSDIIRSAIGGLSGLFMLTCFLIKHL